MTIGIIPARWGSTRFEGKVLAFLQGKPLIQHVWERAKRSKLLDEVIIACDDKRIQEAALKFNARVVMTSPHHSSGTDRMAEVIKTKPCDLVVNIQGDGPMIDPKVIDRLVVVLSNASDCPVATVIKKISREEEINNPNVVKVVINKNNEAMYFSRSAIPYDRSQKKERGVYYKHLGIYAYRREFLLQFTGLPSSILENRERLEQLRVLEAGYKIKIIETEIETMGVDTPEDLNKVEALLNSNNQETITKE